MNGGPATSASLFGPKGVATDAAGNIYIADTMNQQIRKVDAVTGIIVPWPGLPDRPATMTAPSRSARLNSPLGVAVDTAGTIVDIADEGNDMIRVVTGGNVDTVEAGTLDSPSGVAVAALDGTLYIADTDNHRIQRVSGEVSHDGGGDGDGRLLRRWGPGDGGAAQSPGRCRGRLNRQIPVYRGSDQQQDPKSRLHSVRRWHREMERRDRGSRRRVGISMTFTEWRTKMKTKTRWLKIGLFLLTLLFLSAIPLTAEALTVDFCVPYCATGTKVTKSETGAPGRTPPTSYHDAASHRRYSGWLHLQGYDPEGGRRTVGHAPENHLHHHDDNSPNQRLHDDRTVLN